MSHRLRVLFQLFCALALASFLIPQSQGEVDTTAFPHAASKKGLQVQMVPDALALGIKHAALNVNLPPLLEVGTNRNSGEFSLTLDDREYFFNRGAVEHLDAQIKPLSERGVVVSLILLVYAGSNETLNRLLVHPKYDPKAPNHLSAFNTSTAPGRSVLRACVEFLARRYSDPREPHGRVWNYIVGNEVNSHWFWCNMGRVTMEEFADDYLQAVRLCHQAVRKYSQNARVYLSLEHHWMIHYPGGDEHQTFPGRPFLDYFARRARETGDFDWHLAFHPYPENLFDCRTWNDKSALPSPDSPRITFKNLEVLVAYFRRAELRFAGEPRRIILSEQGFHSPESAAGEELQAAAFCYAYYKVAHLEGIDAFILHRHVDHGHEGGLNLGLWTRNKSSANPAEPLAQKRIYNIFKGADAEDGNGWRESFRFALPIIGIPDWSALLQRTE